MRKSLTTILTIFLCIILMSCENDDSNNTLLQNIETNLTITEGAGNESAVFDQGESLIFVIKIRNLTNETQTLRFSSGQLYDIEVYDADDNLIWNWANDKAFLTVETELVFIPNEIKTFEEIWDQISNEGNPISLGTYNAEFIGFGSLESAGPYSFEIKVAVLLTNR